MKKTLFFLLFFIFSIGYAQNISIKIIVKDFETEQPIDEVTITALKTKQGFLTNADGEVQLTLSKHSVLEFSHSTYNTYSIKSENLNKKVNIVYLDSKTQLLDEVVLTKEHPQDILKALVESSKDKITIPANLKVYLREFYKRNDKFVFFNDGLVNFQIFGNSRKIETDILVEQNRSVGLLDGDIDDGVLGYNLNNIIENYYQFTYIDEILSKRARKDYDFQVKTYPLNEDFLVIRALPYDDANGVLSDFYIVYDIKKRIIMEVSAMVSQKRLQILEVEENSKIHKLEYKNVFKIEDGFYHLANSKEVIGFYKKYKGEKRKIEVKNHMVVTNFDKKMFQYDKRNIFTDKSLINKKTTVFTEYWDFDSGLKPTDKEKEIIQSLVAANDSID